MGDAYTLTSEQIQSTMELVNGLMKSYGLSQKNIYEHDVISWKTDGEGTIVWDSIKDKLDNPEPSTTQPTPTTVGSVKN